MRVEEKYLDKNYYIADKTIFKTTGVSTTWFSVVNDIKLIFFLPYEQSKYILENWVTNKGVDPEDLYMFDGATVGFIEEEKHIHVFPIHKFEHFCSMETIEIPIMLEDSAFKQRVRGREQHDIKMVLLKTHQDERFVEYLLDKPGQIFQLERPNKFNLTVISKTNTKYICQGCLLTQIDYNIDCDYNEDGYYGSELEFKVVVKPDLVKVELMSDES